MLRLCLTSYEIFNKAQYGLAGEFLSSVWALNFILLRLKEKFEDKLVTTENMIIFF